MDVFGIHGLSGLWGAIATGIFATPAINGVAGLLYGNPNQLTIQIIASIATMVYAFVVSYIIARLIKATRGMKVDEKTEVKGLDTQLHEESGYRI